MGLGEEAVNGLNSERIGRIFETMHGNLRRQPLNNSYLTFPTGLRFACAAKRLSGGVD